MSFKRFFSRFLHPKSRRQLRQRGVVTPTASHVVTFREPGALRGRAHPVPEPGATDQNVVQPFMDAVVEDSEVEESEGESDSEARDTHLVVNVQTVQPSTDAIFTKAKEVEQHQDRGESDGEEDNMSEVLPYDPARTTQHWHEMITRHLYIAMIDDDRQIAALRTLDRERYTHIVRIGFNPPSCNNITPSSWGAQTMYSSSGAHELRLTCPAFTFHYDGRMTALNEKQIREARGFIMQAVPESNDEWVERGHKLPFSRDECDDTRLLIVAPLYRCADVIAILASLTGESADQVSRTIQWLKLVHSHLRGDHLGNHGLDKANRDEVSKQKW